MERTMLMAKLPTPYSSALVVREIKSPSGRSLLHVAVADKVFCGPGLLTEFSYLVTQFELVDD